MFQELQKIYSNEDLDLIYQNLIRSLHLRAHLGCQIPLLWRNSPLCTILHKPSLFVCALQIIYTKPYLHLQQMVVLKTFRSYKLTFCFPYAWHQYTVRTITYKQITASQGTFKVPKTFLSLATSPHLHLQQFSLP